jgi:hypothetical protein
MGKLLVALLAFALLIPPANAQLIQQGYQQMFIGAAEGNAVKSDVATYHRVSWTPSGTVSACTVQTKESADAVNWVNLGSASDCTMAGNSGLNQRDTNFLRVDITAFTGTGSVSTLWQGLERQRTSGKANIPNLGAGLRAEGTLTWNTALPTADYTVMGCIIQDGSDLGLGLSVERIRSTTAASITIQVVNLSLVSLSGAIHCGAEWP